MNDLLSRALAIGSNLDRDADVPVIEYIAGLYPRGMLSIVAAPAGTGKTWFMKYIACRLSVGGNILSGLVPKSKRYKSLIFAGETGEDLLNLRLKATCWNYDKKRIRIYDAIKMQIADVPIMLNTKEGKATFIGILDYEQPDIVFFDTLISFHTADENKQSEMTGMYSFLVKTANAFKCAIVLNHHTRKRSQKYAGAGYTQDDVIGTSTGVRLASQVFILTDTHKMQATLEDDEGMPTIEVHNVKSWGKRIPNFTYKFYTDDASGKLDFAIDWGTTASNQEWSTRERVQKYIESVDVGGIITREEVASSLSISKDNARKYLEEFTKRGVLEQVKLLNSTAWRVVLP